MNSRLRLANRARSFFSGAQLVIVHEFHKPPYGGGNQFLLALEKEWKKQGLDVGRNRVGSRTRAVLFNSFNFEFDRLRKMKRDGLRMVHRVDGPISAYRGKDDEIDRRIWEINDELADATILQSQYSLNKNREMGFNFRNPVVIHNAADPDVFHPRNRAPFPSGKARIKLISTSWSDNVKKGTDVYAWLDSHLNWDKYEYTFVGRCNATFQNIRLVEAVPSEKLATILRDHHIFITASENDPCSNSLIEALSCGLPAVFRKSGGHGELVQGGGVGFEDREQIPSGLDKIADAYGDFQKCIAVSSIVNVASEYYRVLTAQD
jgi:glycosyltransferase involved in cell wall biosynthesis